MRSSGLVVAFLTSTATAAMAGNVEVSPDLRARAIQACTADAQRLCPETLLDEGRVVACMSDKRALLSAPCRQVYDEVSQAVTR